MAQRYVQTVLRVELRYVSTTCMAQCVMTTGMSLMPELSVIRLIKATLVSCVQSTCMQLIHVIENVNQWNGSSMNGSYVVKVHCMTLIFSQLLGQ